MSGRPGDPKLLPLSNVAEGCKDGDGATLWLRTRLSRSSTVVFAASGLRGAAERGGGNAETGQVDGPVNLGALSVTLTWEQIPLLTEWTGD